MSRKAFSLIELLVALSILAVVAAIITPRLLGVGEQAQNTVARQMASELNSTYANWKASGGAVSGTPFGSMILSLLSNPSPNRATVSAVVGGAPVSVSDSPLSKRLSITLPDGLPNLDPSVTRPNNIVVSSGTSGRSYTIIYSGDQFVVIPAANVSKLNWGTENTENYYADLPPVERTAGYVGRFYYPQDGTTSGTLYTIEYNPARPDFQYLVKARFSFSYSNGYPLWRLSTSIAPLMVSGNWVF